MMDIDDRFLAAFEAAELTPDGFRHREHLRVAYIYLTLHRFDVAREKMESGLRNLLAKFGAPPSAYHETMTSAWLLAVAHFMHTGGPTASFADFLEAGGARLLEKEIMATHYSATLLASDAARERFVEPDLQRIPQHVG